MTPHILLVEDEPVLRLTIGDALRANSFHVTEAPDGETGERVALREAIDLVLLDVMLPGKSGFEVLRALRPAPLRPLAPRAGVARLPHAARRRNRGSAADSR